MKKASGVPVRRRFFPPTCANRLRMYVYVGGRQRPRSISAKSSGSLSFVKSHAYSADWADTKIHRYPSGDCNVRRIWLALWSRQPQLRLPSSSSSSSSSSSQPGPAGSGMRERSPGIKNRAPGGQLGFARTNISLMYPSDLLRYFPVPLVPSFSFCAKHTRLCE